MSGPVNVCVYSDINGKARLASLLFCFQCEKCSTGGSDAGAATVGVHTMLTKGTLLCSIYASEASNSFILNILPVLMYGTLCPVVWPKKH